MFQKKNLLFLLMLLVISFSLRIYKIDTAPSGVQPDEASLGYNAYSILKTGKDEHGVSHPLIFQAFGDQKLPTYIYLLVPSIKAFGLNNFAIRFPAAVIGTLLSLFIYVLLLEFGFSRIISFIGALIAATSPSQIILSRIFGYESNLGLMFFVLGIIFSFKTFRTKRLFYAVFAGITFGLTWYSYIAYRLIAPITIGAFILIYMRAKKFINLNGTILIVSFLIIVSPLIFLSFMNQGVARFNQVNSTSYLGEVLKINESRGFCANSLPKVFCYLNANKLESFIRTFSYRYIETFSPNYLFLDGDKNTKFINVDDYGLFYVIVLPFYLAAFVYLWSRFFAKKMTKNELFIIIGLIVTSLPSILVDEPQKVRLSGLFPFLILFLGYGLSQIIEYFKKMINDKYIHSFIITSIMIFTSFFMINLITVHIHKYEIAFGTYIPKLMRYLGQQNKKTQIYIRSITEGIVFYAYVNKVDPTIFQKSVIRQKPDAIGFVHATDLENIHITTKNIYEIYCLAKRNNVNTLYVTNENLLRTNEVNKIKKIIFSENGVDTLGLVYDVNDITNKNIDCKNILK